MVYDAPASPTKARVRSLRSRSCSAIDGTADATPSGRYSSHHDGRTSNRPSQSDELPYVAVSTSHAPANEWVSAVWFRRHFPAILYSAVSLIVLVVLLHMSFFAARVEGSDGEDVRPDFFSCRSWGYGTSCGLWGVDCRPFETDWSAIRCPSRCTMDKSSALAVYGSGPYRADSRICRAAIHAGVIGSNGGCALFRYAGPANAFHQSTANGVSTTEFLSWFPKTLEFQAASSTYCSDLSWLILVVGTLALMGYALFPALSSSVSFHVLVAWGFIYVRLIGQPSSVNYAGVAISTMGELFILLAAASLAYRCCAVYTFSDWAIVSLRRRAVMWALCYVLPFHALLHLNMFAYVPWLNVDLGGYEKTETNAGTFVVYGFVGLAGLYCCAWCLRELYRTRRWRTFLAGYALVVALVLLSWALFPSTSFHLHHAMIGAFILPITRFPAPTAACSQAVALGLFVQGYAAWGWTSYLETMPTYLTISVPDEAPTVLNVTADGASVEWKALGGVDAYSLRLNSVEVYRGLNTSTVLEGLQANMTYFIEVAGVADWGTDGEVGPETNFTTLTS